MSTLKPLHTPLNLGLACIATSVLVHVIGLTSASRGMRVTPATSADREIVLQAELFNEVASTIPAQVKENAPVTFIPANIRVSAKRDDPASAIQRQPSIAPPATAQTTPSEPYHSSELPASSLPESVPLETDPVAPELLTPAAATSAQLPPTATPSVSLARSAVLQYSVGYGIQDNPAPQGISTVRWQFAEDKFEIESISEATGLTSLLIRGTLTETSVGRVTAQGLAPVRYGEKRASRGERAIHFQRERGVVSFSNHPQEVPLPLGVQDRLALRYQLGLLLQATPSLQQPGSTMEVPVATPSGIEVWKIVVQKHEILHTQAGDFPVLYLVRDKRLDRPYDQTLELWIAPSVAWLPVRVRIVDANARTLDAVLTKAQLQ
jgi:hypothetical protein